MKTTRTLQLLALLILCVGCTTTDNIQRARGVLAVNTDKATYLADDTVRFAIGLLDEEGEMICDANMTLTITGPDGKHVLTTEDGTLTKSRRCAVKDTTTEPDYAAQYIPAHPGEYAYDLSVITTEGLFEKEGGFTVQDTVAFDVRRDGPTRLYPVKPDTMRITITAHEDYVGIVKESIPEFWAIKLKGDFVVNDSGGRVIEWDVDLAEGETTILEYTFDAPDESPVYYELGPLRIGEWEEAQPWQVASDIAALPGGTVELRAQGCKNQNESATQNLFGNPCSGTYPSTCTGDKLSCDDSANELARASKSGPTTTYGGVNISAYNSSITDCVSITTVRLCYEFWGSSGQHTCTVGVNNGSGSFADTAATCSDTAPGVTCIDVTSDKTWTCENFFTGSGQRATAKAQAVRTGGSGAQTWNFDALYFNVTYSDSSDTCTPTEGENWDVDATDNCVVDGQDYSVLNMSISGNTGTFTVRNSNISTTGCYVQPNAGQTITVAVFSGSRWANAC